MFAEPSTRHCLQVGALARPSLLGQLAAYGVALMCRAWPVPTARWWPIRRGTAFFSLDCPAVKSMVDLPREPHAHLWHPTADRITAP